MPIEHADGSAIGVGMAATPHRFQLVAGPFLAAVADTRPLADLVDDLSLEPFDARELLHLTMLDRAR